MLAQTNPPGGCTVGPDSCCPSGTDPVFCPGCPPCVPAPFNGDLLFLLIAGLILGIYFVKKRNLAFQ